MVSSSLSHAPFVAKMALVMGLVLVLGVRASSGAERRVVSIQVFAANDANCSGAQTSLGVFQYVTLEPGVCTRFAVTAGIRASSDFKSLDLFPLDSSHALSCEGEPTATMIEGGCVLDEEFTRSRFKYELLPPSSEGANSVGSDLCLISTENYAGPNCTTSVNITQEFTLKHAECTAYFTVTHVKVDCRKRVWGTYANSTCTEAALLAQGGDGQCVDRIYGSAADSAVVDFIGNDAGAGAKLTSWLSPFFLSSSLYAL